MVYEDYILNLQEKCDEVYSIATQARAKGLDPTLQVEIPQAHDLADRTQKLLDFLHYRNTAEQIRELTTTYNGNRELVALEIGKIVAAETFLYGIAKKCIVCDGKGEVKKGEWRTEGCFACGEKGRRYEYLEIPHFTKTLESFNLLEEFNNKPQIADAIYHGVCAGLAVLTEGILVAPLEGVVSSKILKNSDGSECASISFAGPIRSAGGTGQALSVLIGDILRRMFQLDTPIMTFEEVERYKEEVSVYGRGLQYRPSNPQIEIIAQNCPIYIDGEGVGAEVTGQRNLERVPTNKVREGSILVMCEGLVLKAPKILKYVDELKLDGWEWLREFTHKSKDTDDNEGVQPDFKYLGDVLAGRPVFGQPLREGGFRLRYGRSRLGGLAATSIHPLTMTVLNSFIIIGTQIKYERPGKATVLTPCTEIDTPYVQFKDGSAKRLTDDDGLIDGLATDADWPIEKVWDLGEILIPVGEFIENNHNFIPSPYNADYHEALMKGKLLRPCDNFMDTITQAKENNIPLNPKYVPFISDLSAEELINLNENLTLSVCGEGSLRVNPEVLNLAYRLCVDVRFDGDNYYLVGDKSYLILHTHKLLKHHKTNLTDRSALELMNEILPFEIRSPTTYRIGARMGKPEGAKLREMKPPIHCLFPVGFNVGNQRKVVDLVALDEEVHIGIRETADGEETIMGVMNGAETTFKDVEKRKFDWSRLWRMAKDTTHTPTDLPIKGVKGMTSAEKIPENLAKGILRYNHDISVFRDGTIRFDMVDITMTHFKPCEIGLSVEKAQELGYEVEDETTILELKPQDIILSENIGQQLLDTSKFVDRMLVEMYELEPYYKATKIEDLYGHLMMGLAPHTSGAILCRMIGVARIKGHYGHPFFHAAKRRNCDGDIDSVMFLMDGLINFSRKFLATTRGGQMDAPLILTTKINPSEIDKEALNVDIGWEYPLSFYDATQRFAKAQEAKSCGIITVEDVLGTPQEMDGFGFTHGTRDCSEGPKNNPYNTLESMRQKTIAQFALGETIEAVDNTDQASRLIDRHLIRDMRGNLRAYGQQKVRCTKCGESYRRPPLSGNCTTVVDERIDSFSGKPIKVFCPGNIILTVSKGSVKKYGALMGELVDKYGCTPYTKELYRLVAVWVSQSFDDDEKNQTSLF
jgi:DNA polymerase II large subunit